MNCKKTKRTYRVGFRILWRGSEVLLEARVLTVLEATLAVGFALGGLVVALAVVLHLALAGNALGAGGSAGGCALLGLLLARRLLVAVGSGLRFTFSTGRLLGLLRLGLLRHVLALFLGAALLRLLVLGLLVLGLLILRLLLLRLLLLLGLSLLVMLLMVLLVAVVGIARGRGPKEVRAGRGDGKSRDEPVASALVSIRLLNHLQLGTHQGRSEPCSP